MPVFESFVWETTIAIAYNLYASLLDSREELLLNKITEKRLNAWGKTLQALETIAKYQPINPNWRETEWSNTTGALINEECLFYVNGSWMYNIWMGIDEKKTMNVMPAEFPSFNGELKTYPGAYQITWGVLKNAPHREEAVKFLLAMNKPQVAETWGRLTKCPTGIKGILSNVTFGGDQFEVFSKYIQNKYGTNTYRHYESGMWILNDQHVNTPVYYMDVVEGKISAKQAMRNIRQSIGR
jgi:ABC-type glycerol-3-phosphate transport system substrate-binding protein